MCSKAIFSAWSHFMYLSPATQELWQSQAWPLLRRSIFTTDFCSNDSAVLTQIICAILSLIYWFLYSYEHELISLPCFLLLLILWKRTGLFPSPPAPSHLPRAAQHLGHSHTLWGGLHSNVLPPGTLELSVCGVWSTARKALVGPCPAEDGLLPSSSSSALCLVSQRTPAAKWDS